ncbi:MAG: sulfotransferase domain-containing protein [Bryobacteraceae bacterium]
MQRTYSGCFGTANSALASPRLARSLSNASRLLGRLNRIISFVAWWAEFVPRDDDIYIVSYPRSGTTLMQMLLYQLTTDGSLDFRHISEVSPYLERSILRGRDLNALRSPRIIKTHFPADKLPSLPGRFIYVARQGPDVAVSNYQFSKSHRRYRGTLAQFLEGFLGSATGLEFWLAHIRGWRKRLQQGNGYLVRYEDLLADFQQTLSGIARYCAVQLTAEQRHRIEERCRFTFMKEHEEKFDFATEILWEHGLTLGSFIREGKAGSGPENLSEAQLAAFEKAVRYHRGRDLAEMAWIKGQTAMGPTSVLN